MAIFLGVRSGLVVVLVNEDTHLRQKLHLLLIQVFCVYFRHCEHGPTLSHLTANTCKRYKQDCYNCVVNISLLVQVVCQL